MSNCSPTAGPSGSAAPAPGTRRPTLLDALEIGGRQTEVGGLALACATGSDGWLSTGATSLSSTIIASAKPPVKHIPTAPTPGPPHCSCTSRASARSQTMAGDVRPVAQVVELHETHPSADRSDDRRHRGRLAGRAEERREHRCHAGLGHRRPKSGDTGRDAGHLVHDHDAGASPRR